MGFHTEFAEDFEKFTNDYGKPVRFRYFTVTFANSDYDDDVSLSQSGTDLWTSGIPLPIRAPQGSQESRMLNEGKLKENDTTLYVQSGVQLSGTWRVRIGSPTGDEYAPIEGGVNAPQPGGVKIYQKAFVRIIPVGSLAEE